MDEIKSPTNVSIQYLKNVGPKKAKLFNRLGIKTVNDLLEYYPKRYEDRRVMKKIADLLPQQIETVRGEIFSVEETRPKKGLTIIKAWLKDNTGCIPAVWFNQPFLNRVLKPGQEIIVYGKIETKYLQTQVYVHDYEILDQGDTISADRLVPVYRSTEKLNQKTIRSAMYSALGQFAHGMEEFLPDKVVKEHGLMMRKEAYWQIHFPLNETTLQQARKRLVFEELLLMYLSILKNKLGVQEKGFIYVSDDNILTKFQQVLPFNLTGAQERVIKEIFGDMEDTAPMARLVQGDVGSGKTAVAAAALYKATVSGFQGAMMVPTEILAEQHYISLSGIFEPLGVKTALITGSTGKKERSQILSGISIGDINVIVGTHALIQNEVKFKHLALAVTDEQHRFGVKQRTDLQQKGINPDVLVMTATPIPRTLALTVYGDLSISVIDELPPGRKAIKTFAVGYDFEDRVLVFLRKEITAGRQAYIVCPQIEESEKQDLDAAIELADRLRNHQLSGINVGLLHGKMPGKEKEIVMNGFRAGTIQVLVATTVIEVGVNIPNASIILIRDAERFGLAQLHQLRGRIGRGQYQSYCILMHNAKSSVARKRMQTMEQTLDGFKIAEADLIHRGPGEFLGTRQHGLPDLKITNLVEDTPLLAIVRQVALDILVEYPGLDTDEGKKLNSMVIQKFHPMN